MRLESIDGAEEQAPRCRNQPAARRSMARVAGSCGSEEAGEWDAVERGRRDESVRRRDESLRRRGAGQGPVSGFLLSVGGWERPTTE